jgi:hypothetical protein
MGQVTTNIICRISATRWTVGGVKKLPASLYFGIYIYIYIYIKETRKSFFEQQTVAFSMRITNHSKSYPKIKNKH